MARFVDNLTRLRDSSEGLELCEFIIRDSIYISKKDMSSWIQKVLTCKPQILIVD
jgi:hypothetical protein